MCEPCVLMLRVAAVAERECKSAVCGDHFVKRE